jgi:hypothetical protein
MTGQVPALALLFGLIFGLNVIPAFAPPTWMASLSSGSSSPRPTRYFWPRRWRRRELGRLVLAKLSQWLVRRKRLSEAHRQNIDIIKEQGPEKSKVT